MGYNATIDGEWNGEAVKIRGRKVTGRTAFEIGLIVEGQAKLLCPVDLGLLAGSITTKAPNQGTRAQAPASAADEITPPDEWNEVLVGTPVFYGPYVEFGTIRSAAQPFLRPALDLAQGKVLTIVKNGARYEFADYLK